MTEHTKRLFETEENVRIFCVENVQILLGSTDALPTIRYKIPASNSCDGFKKQPVTINGSKSKYSINCIVIGGTIKNILIANASSPTLSVLVSNTTNGKLTIQLPRELVMKTLYIESMTLTIMEPLEMLLLQK